LVIDRTIGCENSLQYLERTTPTLTAPWSLAWSILALATHQRPIAWLRSTLLAIPHLFYIEDNSTLALVSLAPDHKHALARLEATILSLTRPDFLIGTGACRWRTQSKRCHITPLSSPSR
jgi:hypothetical protein